MRDQHEFTFTSHNISVACTRKANLYNSLFNSAQESFNDLIDALDLPRWKVLLELFTGALNPNQRLAMGVEYSQDIATMLELIREIEKNERIEKEYRNLAAVYASQDKSYTLSYQDVLYFGLAE